MTSKRGYLIPVSHPRPGMQARVEVRKGRIQVTIFSGRLGWAMDEDVPRADIERRAQELADGVKPCAKCNQFLNVGVSEAVCKPCRYGGVTKVPFTGGR